MAVAFVEADRYDRRASRVSDPDLYMPLKPPSPILVAEAEEAQAKLDEAQGKTASSVETAAAPVPTLKPDEPTKAAAHRAPHPNTLLAASVGPAAPKPVKEKPITEKKPPLAADRVESPAPAPAPTPVPAATAGKEPQDADPSVVQTNGTPAFGDPEKQFWMPL